MGKFILSINTKKEKKNKKSPLIYIVMEGQSILSKSTKLEEDNKSHHSYLWKWRLIYYINFSSFPK